VTSLAANAVITGIAVGAVYGLIAIGYTVVFNATRVFNLAQGDLVMVGVLLSYFALDVAGWPQWAAFLLVVVCVPLVSVVEERLVVRPFLRRPHESIGWFISTLAFGLVVETIATLLYGDHPPLKVPSPFPSGALRAGSIATTPRYLFAIGTLVIVAVLIEIFYQRTWLGRAMRATADDRELATLRGVRPGRMSLLSFGIGGLIAAIAGYVVAPIVYANVAIGLTYSIKGFIALAIGGFGSIRGAIVGALAVGIAEQLFDLYVSPRYDIVASLALLMVILAFRPVGLFRSTVARQV
jgi:branched-chain amino acid transport system permease protein